MTKMTLLRAAMLVSASSIATLAFPALAQDAQTAEPQVAEQGAEATEDSGTIVVTGSRIQQRADYNAPTRSCR